MTIENNNNGLELPQVEWVEISTSNVSTYIRFKKTDKGTSFTFSKGVKDLIKNGKKFLSIGIANGKLYGKLNGNGEGFEVLSSSEKLKPTYNAGDLLDILADKGINVPFETRLPIIVLNEGETETIVEINVPTVSSSTTVNKTTPKQTAKK